MKEGTTQMATHTTHPPPLRYWRIAFWLVVALAGSALLVLSQRAGQAVGTSQHEQACFKHDPPTANPHGHLNADGTAWILNEFDPVAFAPWDHWESLTVKGGPNGETVYDHPTAGVEYFTPGLNPAGQHFDVSHVLVCKGKYPPQTEDTTTTQVQDTTTTQVIEDTTTTAVVEETTTTSPETERTTATTTTAPPVNDTTTTTTTTPAGPLPQLGIDVSPAGTLPRTA